eukprot:Skav221753  [mRNA]  locus=scaffold2018:135724:137368:+ [translate_table: standard]
MVLQLAFRKVNANKPAGTGEAPVSIVCYPDEENHQPITDFISSDRKKMIGHMKDGNQTPPADQVKKRQWSHDLVAMRLITQKVVPRIQIVQGRGLFGGDLARAEIKPRLPCSGRTPIPPPSMVSLEGHVGLASSFAMPVRSPAQPNQLLIAVKQEALESTACPFSQPKRQQAKVIELDSRSPPPKKPRSILASQDDELPAVGTCPGEGGELLAAEHCPDEEEEFLGAGCDDFPKIEQGEE